MFHSIIVISLLGEISAYSILAVLPVKSKSHNAFASAVMENLAQKGHNVTVFTVFPKLQNLPSYHEIDIGHCIDPIHDELHNIDYMVNAGVHKLAQTVQKIFTPHPEQLKTCKPFQNLFDSSSQFDLLITQPFGSDVFAVLSHKLNVPLINVFSLPTIYPQLAERMGSMSNPSIVPSIYLQSQNFINFFNRIRNLYHYFVLMLYINSRKNDNEISQDWLGPGVPPLEDITKNTSLIFTNSHFSFTPLIPQPPGVVEIGGIHIKHARKLPENIEKFINESKHGVVYFSMGSLLRSKTFPEDKRNAFLYAFSKIPQRVLWKWEDDTLQGRPSNVLINKWLPQRDILAHPNVKLFITHGGLLSTSEAIYEGVPIIGIPIFADQACNVMIIEAQGAGELLRYQDITKKSVLEKIHRLLNDSRYQDNMKQMSTKYKDRLLSPSEAVVYWTEYVIRNKGAHQLKPASVNMPWYQYLLLDVIAFIIFVLLFVSLILYFIIVVILKRISPLIF